MNSKKELVKKPKAVAKPKPAKKTSVDKPKAAKKTSVDKPKAAKKASVDKPKAKPVKKASVAKPKAKPVKKASVAKPKPVAKPKAIRKVYVEQLNKKRNWKGGANDDDDDDDDDIADANELIGILKEVKKEYFQILTQNVYETTVDKHEFTKFVTHFFIKTGTCMFFYEHLGYKKLSDYGIPSTERNTKKNFVLISLFSIIKDICDSYYYIYGLNSAFIKAILKYDYDEEDYYNKLIIYINSIYPNDTLSSRSSHGSQSLQSSQNSIRNSEVSIDPSILALRSSQDSRSSRGSTASTLSSSDQYV